MKNNNHFKLPKCNTVDLNTAREICIAVEGVIMDLPCHVALTGGCLYKDGPRKDMDILFYRVRQEPHPDKSEILKRLANIGFNMGSTYDWCQKSRYQGIDIDLFFPELYPLISTSLAGY